MSKTGGNPRPGGLYRVAATMMLILVAGGLRAQEPARPPLADAARTAGAAPGQPREPRLQPQVAGSAARGATLPLAPPTKKSSGERRQRPTAARHPLVAIGSSLAVVLGLFGIVAWASRRWAPQPPVTLPGEVVERLGRIPLEGRQFLHLVRVGNKLLLLSVTAQGTETLTEITDPQEVDRLAGLCQPLQTHSITETFRQVLQQAGAEPRRGK